MCVHMYKDCMLLAADSQLRQEWRNCWTRGGRWHGLSSQVVHKLECAGGASATAIATALLLLL